MHSTPAIEERLWNWLDGEANDAEATELQQLIANDTQCKEKYDKLLAVRQMLQQDMELMQPSIRFTKNVMDQIAATAIKATAKKYINTSIIYGIGGLFVMFLLAVVFYAFSLVGWQSATGSANSSWNFNWAHWFSGPAGTIVTCVVILLCMVLLDQYLRPKMLHKKQ